MKYIASVSFGKDSLATVLLANIHNEPLDVIVFSEVMFDDNTTGENPEHIKWIYEKAIPKVESLGYKVVVLRSKKSYVDNFTAKIIRSKYPDRLGKMRGFPISGMCSISSECKLKPIHKFIKSCGEDARVYVGIAIDEPKRLARLKPNQISLLEKYNFTEQMAMDLCKEHDLLSPIYKKNFRGGCWFCPNAKIAEYVEFKRENENIFNKLIDLYEKNKDNMVSKNFSVNSTFENLLKSIDIEEDKQKRQVTLF